MSKFQYNFKALSYFSEFSPSLVQLFPEPFQSGLQGLHFLFVTVKLIGDGFVGLSSYGANRRLIITEPSAENSKWWQVISEIARDCP